MKLRFRPAAENDLIEIGDYIACDNPRAAAEFIATIREKCTALVETPNIGGKRPELSAGLRSIRSVTMSYSIVSSPTRWKS